MPKITTDQLFEYLEDTSKKTFTTEKIKKNSILEKLKEFPKVLAWIQSKKDYNILVNKEIANIVDMLLSGRVNEDGAIGQMKKRFAYNESNNEKIKKEKLFTNKKKNDKIYSESQEIPQINPLKSHDEHEEYKKGRLQKIEEVSKKVDSKNNPIYGAGRVQKWKDSASKIDELVHKMIDLINPFNQVKQKLDAEYKNFQTNWGNLVQSEKEKHIKQMNAAFQELRKVLLDHNFTEIVNKLGIMKRSKMTRLKHDDNLYNELIRKIDFVNDTYKSIPNIIKRMQMSDKQRSAADSNSKRMKARWSE